MTTTKKDGENLHKVGGEGDWVKEYYFTTYTTTLCCKILF
jgi:hypothetical protein